MDMNPIGLEGFRALWISIAHGIHGRSWERYNDARSASLHRRFSDFTQQSNVVDCHVSLANCDLEVESREPWPAIESTPSPPAKGSEEPAELQPDLTCRENLDLDDPCGKFTFDLADMQSRAAAAQLLQVAALQLTSPIQDMSLNGQATAVQLLIPAQSSDQNDSHHDGLDKKQGSLSVPPSPPSVPPLSVPCQGILQFRYCNDKRRFVTVDDVAHLGGELER